MHPWHSVDWPEDSVVLPAVVTVPKDGTVRYALDRQTGLLRVVALLPEESPYPGNGGLIPRTATRDQAPVECFILGERPLQPLVLARVRPIGLLKATLGESRLICVHCDDSDADGYESLQQYPQYRLASLRQCFEDEIKSLGRDGEVTGTGGREEALAYVREARVRYGELFPEKK